MRGPIDYVLVEFKGNKFDGSILKELEKSSDKGIIDVLDLAVVSKDENGEVVIIDVATVDDEIITTFITSNGITGDMIGEEDVDEVAEIMENNTSAGLLIIEHLWAKDLKQAIFNADGVLVADGRIHPEAARELDNN